MYEDRDTSWRYSAETPKLLYVIDARVLLPGILALYHMRLWTLQLVLACVAGFAILGLWRITPVEAIKAVFLWISTLGFRWGHVGRRVRRYDHG